MAKRKRNGGIVSSRLKQSARAANQKPSRGSENLVPYSALERDNNEIRTLVLHAGAGEDPLQATLKTYRLNDCPAFEALSYAWGDPSEVEPMSIDKSCLMVTRNLHIALRHLRHRRSSRNLWVDAICINQSDTDERNHQVFLMYSVYSKADRVLIWLGEPRNHSDLAMNRLIDLAQGKLPPGGVDKSFKDLICEELLDREWWSRLWVVQEVVLARSDPFIVCGSKSLGWKAFMEGIWTAYLNLMDGSERPEYFRRGLQIAMLRDLRRTYEAELQNHAYQSTTLGMILVYTKDLEASDPRDKIYGCLGILAKAEREAIRPEYQKSKQVLYHEVAQYLLEHDSYPFFASFSFSRRNRLYYPSWVPDFSSQYLWSRSDPLALSVISGRDCQHGQRRVSFQDGNRVLVITGVFIDSISAAVELKDNEHFLTIQRPQLESIAQRAMHRKAPWSHPRHHLQRFKKYEDILHVLAVGHSELVNSGPTALKHLATHIFSGRYFFVTELGFVGIAVRELRKNDVVTVLFGENLPIMLRPRGSSYQMLGAGYVSGITDGELTSEMYESGFLEKTTFLIR